MKRISFLLGLIFLVNGLSAQFQNLDGYRQFKFGSKCALIGGKPNSHLDNYYDVVPNSDDFFGLSILTYGVGCDGENGVKYIVIELVERSHKNYELVKSKLKAKYGEPNLGEETYPDDLGTFSTWKYNGKSIVLYYSSRLGFKVTYCLTGD